MPKNAYVHARVDKRLKSQADKVLAQLVLSTSDLINILLHQVVLTKGVPFDVRIPNDETVAAMAELDAGKGDRFDGTADELFAHILSPRRRRKA